MPVFEYRCPACGEEFERLVLSASTKVACPACGGHELVKKVSSFGTSGTDKKVSSGSCDGCRKGSCAGCR
jgi:putative FmdB family regulatory protein